MSGLFVIVIGSKLPANPPAVFSEGKIPDSACIT